MGRATRFGGGLSGGGGKGAAAREGRGRRDGDCALRRPPPLLRSPRAERARSVVVRRGGLSERFNSARALVRRRRSSNHARARERERGPERRPLSPPPRAAAAVDQGLTRKRPLRATHALVPALARLRQLQLGDGVRHHGAGDAHGCRVCFSFLIRDFGCAAPLAAPSCCSLCLSLYLLVSERGVGCLVTCQGGRGVCCSCWGERGVRGEFSSGERGRGGGGSSKERAPPSTLSLTHAHFVDHANKTKTLESTRLSHTHVERERERARAPQLKSAKVCRRPPTSPRLLARCHSFPTPRHIRSPRPQRDPRRQARPDSLIRTRDRPLFVSVQHQRARAAVCLRLHSSD